MHAQLLYTRKKPRKKRKQTLQPGTRAQFNKNNAASAVNVALHLCLCHIFICKKDCESPDGGYSGPALHADDQAFQPGHLDCSLEADRAQLFRQAVAKRPKEWGILKVRRQCQKKNVPF